MKILQCLISILFAFPLAASAQQMMRLDVGLRTIIMVADGEPANDMLGSGIFLQYRFSERWGIVGAYEQTEYDFEQPARVIGLTQDPTVEPIDASAEAAMFTLALRRNYPGGRARASWFWSVGAGVASVEIEEVRGPLASGEIFDIASDAGDELLALANAGVDIRLVDRAYLEIAVRAEQHFADWEIRDRQSGATGNVGDYLATGAHIAVGVRF